MKQTHTKVWDSLEWRIALLIWYLSLLSLYAVLNYPWGAVHSVAIALDNRIPIVPVFVVPYLFFFFPWVSALLLWAFFKRPHVFWRLIVALIAGTIVSYGFYGLYQTVVYRPEILGNDVFSALVRWVYHADARYNAFPSTHTITTTILLATTWPLLRRWWLRVVAVLAAGSIISSTLLIKQHHILDVVAGVAVGVFALWIGGQSVRQFGRGGDAPNLTPSSATKVGQEKSRARPARLSRRSLSRGRTQQSAPRQQR